MPNPFDLSNSDAYLPWRDRKLGLYPASLPDFAVEISDPPSPSPAELDRLANNLARFNLSVFACANPDGFGRRELLELGRRMGLERLDDNLCADEQAVSVLRVHAEGPASDYIPYTNRPLSWHTDGYYNAPDRQVRAWMLYCVQDALEGGENALMDHEIAYIRLRDQDPDLIRALMDPRALTIPANVGKKGELRPASTGPVFSVQGGHLHMRYTARSRNAIWKNDPGTREAREALAQLFSSDDVYIFRHKLAPGEGYMSNNVLHNRTGFSESGDGRSGRTLLRTRYRDRVSPRSTVSG